MKGETMAKTVEQLLARIQREKRRYGHRRGLTERKKDMLEAERMRWGAILLSGREAAREALGNGTMTKEQFIARRTLYERFSRVARAFDLHRSQYD